MTAAAAPEKKTYPDNGKGYNSLGNLSGRLETLEFKETKAKENKPSKTWAMFSVKTGKSVVRGKTYAAKLIPILEGFAEGDDISLFGKLTSNIGTDDKVYTSFVAFSANDDMNPSQVTVAGEVVGVSSTEYADYADLEITTDDAYPEFVRIRLCDELDASNFNEGEKLRISAEPRGKFGEFTATKLLPFVRPKTESTTSKASERFKRTPVVAPATTAAAGPPAAAKRKAPPAPVAQENMSAEDFTENF